ncbi:YbaN family protein [Tropicimonas sp. TH_r6]|uniref:YbaN family protein n=1 Tax=Tropicimonas sp. TH_r6 TaxID=3082085 RepID=UPI002953C88F|nr:YbaN family protein [Tropicimonas sp. TH_r6]MDV7141272.1 YbaN family protein [Tropicimonas sp. TH_r6]
MKVFWATLGGVSLLLGLIGVVLPLLPTVPFILLAAFCFSRSSDRLHDWLVEHAVFGPSIADWRVKGAISMGGKRLATLSIGGVFGLSLLAQLSAAILLLQAVVLTAVLVFIWSRPTG